MNFKIVPAKSFADMTDVARLHKESIVRGFLSSLPLKFLCRLYSAIASSPGSVVLVAKSEDGRFLGFVAATVNTRSLYKQVLSRNWLHFAAALAGVLFSLRVVRKVVETLLYPLKKSGLSTQAILPESPSAELLSIAISAEARGRGIGRGLVNAVDVWMENRGCRLYAVVTDSEDGDSNAFYRSCGFSLADSMMQHGHALNRYLRSLQERAV